MNGRFPGALCNTYINLSNDEIITDYFRDSIDSIFSFFVNLQLNQRDSHVNPMNYQIENFESGEIEVTYSDENEAKKGLVWV